MREAGEISLKRIIGVSEKSLTMEHEGKEV